MEMMLGTEYIRFHHPRNYARNVLVCHLFVSGESVCLCGCVQNYIRTGYNREESAY